MYYFEFSYFGFPCFHNKYTWRWCWWFSSSWEREKMPIVNRTGNIGLSRRSDGDHGDDKCLDGKYLDGKDLWLWLISWGWKCRGQYNKYKNMVKLLNAEVEPNWKYWIIGLPGWSSRWGWWLWWSSWDADSYVGGYDPDPDW